MGRLGKLGLALLTALPWMVVPGTAEATATGMVTVDCTATFPVIPAPVPTPGGTCPGTATVALAGTDNVGLPYTIAGTGVFAAGFTYHEPCAVNGQPGVLLSFAAGIVTVFGVPAEHPIGTPTTATLTSPFTWSRVGLHPVILVPGGPVAVTFANGGAASANPGAGTATFLPPTNYNPNVHQCGVGGPAFTQVRVVVAFAS